MTAKRGKFAPAVTIVEIMAAILILTIAVIGASGYRYYAALDVRKAAMHRTAARVALLLCESWRGQGLTASGTYDPVAHLGSEISITTSVTGPSAADGFTELGRYEIIIDGVHYWVTLSWMDIATELRALNIVAAWDEQGSGADYASTNKTFKLTTYVAR